MVSSSENLAKALEHYLSAHDTLSAVQDSDEVTGRGEASDCGFQDTANDAWRAMRTALYEYRKRCSLKAAASLRPQSIHEPCPHGVILAHSNCVDCHDEGLRAAMSEPE